MRTISEIYNLSFTRAMYDIPLVAPLAKKFRLDVVIRRAIVNEAGGFMEIKLTGSPEEVGRAIADLNTTGVSVSGPLPDTLNGDTIEAMPAYVGRGT